MVDPIPFPAGSTPRSGFERVKSVYTVLEISRQFGLGEHIIRRWTREGLVPTAAGSRTGEFRYDFRALTQFRRARELRNQGLSLRQVEAELQGQMNLYPPREGHLVTLPIRRSAFEEAVALHDRGDPRASDCYRRALEEQECVPDAYCNLGILEFDRGNVAEAFDCFTKALSHDPRHFESHFNLAHLYFESGDLRLARLHYELAARIEPAFGDLYFNLGLVHAVKGEFEQAVDLLKKAKELSAEDDGSRVDDILTRIAGILRSTSER